MIANKTSALRGKVSTSSASTLKVPARVVSCNAATAWSAWDKYVEKRTAVPKIPTASEAKMDEEMAAALKKVAATYKPAVYDAKKSVDGKYKVKHIERKPVALPAGLHEKLEVIGQRQLAACLEDVDIDAASVSYTTTDVNGALCVTGCTVQQGVDKTAYIAMVACETERQASWSRLEGLLLHWGCTEGVGAPWLQAPAGWKAVPNKIVDAGSAQECMFDKKVATPGKQDAVYTTVLQLPIRGALKRGGITFVLKAKDAQNTKWLKDASTDADFFVDLQLLPVVKI